MTSEFPFYHFDDGLKNFLGAGNERENNEQLVSKKLADYKSRFQMASLHLSPIFTDALETSALYIKSTLTGVRAKSK